MPRRGKFDWAKLAASGISGYTEGHRAGRHDAVAQERTDLQRQEYDRRATEAGVEQARRETLRGAFEKARQVKAQQLEVEKTRATGMPIYERQRVEEDIARRSQDMELLGSVIQTLPFDGIDDAKFAMGELASLESREVLSENYARAEIELISAMGTDEEPGFIPPEAGEWYLEKLRTPKSQGGLSPEEVLQYVEQTRKLKAEKDSQLIGRDEVLGTAETIRQAAMPRGQRRANFDQAVSQWQSGLWQKIDPDTYEGLLRVAANVDEPWASLILEPYGLGQGTAGQSQQGVKPTPTPMRPQETAPVASPVPAILQALQANPDRPPSEVIQELGIDPASLSPEDVEALKGALSGG